MEEYMQNKGCNPVRLDLNGVVLLNIILVLNADDTALVAETADMLQKGLTVLREYCLKW